MGLSSAWRSALISHNMCIATRGSTIAHRSLDLPLELGDEVTPDMVHNVVQRLAAYDPCVVKSLQRHAGRNAFGNFSVAMVANMLTGCAPCMFFLLRFAYLCTQKSAKLERRTKVFDQVIKYLKTLPAVDMVANSNPMYTP